MAQVQKPRLFKILGQGTNHLATADLKIVISKWPEQKEFGQQPNNQLECKGHFIYSHDTK